MVTFQLCTVDAVIDICDEALNVIVVWRRNKVRHTEILRFVDCLRRQPDSVSTEYDDIIH